LRPDHDVVIVGGGPAGISTALFLAHLRPELRSRMVVLEKERYPREKYCAGGVGARAEMALARIGVVVDVPHAPATGISRVLPRGKLAARTRHIGRVVRRIEFDHRLAEIAKARGIRVADGVKVTSLEPHSEGIRLGTDGGELRAKVVLGADGVGSMVRKAMGLGAGTWRAQVLEVDTEAGPGEADDLLHFDVGDPAFTGYEWDFPTVVGGKKMVCRGVYHLVLPGESAGTVDLTKRLADRLARFGLDLSRCKKKRYAERGFAPHEPASSPRTLLLGEAAGIDPITGEGIAQAILYGEVAAPYVLSRLSANALDFADWPSVLARTRLGFDMYVRHFLCRRFFGPSRAFYEEAFLDTPEVLELGIRYFGGIRIDRRALLALGTKMARRFWTHRHQEPFRGLPLLSGG
jgi:menaquinone-9 beta-reductase